MATTSAATGLTVEQWDDKWFAEHLRNHPYSAYMGTKETDIVQVKEDLATKQGNKVYYALVNRLSASANDGSSALAGNEESMTSRSFGVQVSLRRNAVTIPEMEEQKSAIDLYKAAKPTLMNWAHDLDAARFVDQLYSINGVAYSSATAAQRDAWLDDNTDRVLFGAAKSNLDTTAPAGGATYDHSGSLANVDSTNDMLTPGALSLMKRMALEASPKIKPIRLGGSNKRYYVAFAHPRCFRDLKENSTIIQAQREVTLTNQNNKLFQGGDIEWDGIIVHEVDDMTTLSSVGASSIDVGGVFLCGAQAFGYAVAKRWKSTMKKEDDYQNERGVGVRSIDGLAKMLFGSGTNDTDDLKDHGVLTGYFAAVADS